MASGQLRALLPREKQINSFAPKILYRNKIEVLGYLEKHPEIENLLVECWPDVLTFFGASAGIELELMVHNENDRYEELIGWIQSFDTVDEGLEKFDLFMDKWLIRQLEITGNKFNFNIEFK